MDLPRRLALTLCLIAVPALTACEARIGATFDPMTRFPAKATWQWDNPSNILPSEQDVGELNLDPIIRNVAASAFAERGYLQATKGAKPDFLLSYRVGLGKILSPTHAEALGSLSLILADPENGRELWVGFTKGGIRVSRSGDERRERLREEVRELLEKFPPDN